MSFIRLSTSPADVFVTLQGKSAGGRGGGVRIWG